MSAERIEAGASRAAFEAAGAEGARARVDWLKWGSLFGFWALFSFLNANQVYFEMLHKPGMHHSWWRIVFWQLAVWWVWGCLTPIVLRVGRRVTGANASWLRGLLIHLPFSLLLPAAHGAASVYIRMVIQPFDVWSDTRPFLDQYGGELRSLFLFDFFVYWAVLGVGYAFDYRKRYNERERDASELKAQLAQARLEALKVQLHPHFLFNTLHTISGLVRGGDRQPAVNMIAGLSALLRRALDSADEQEVPLREELKFVELYLDIQLVRFSDRLTVRTDVEPETLDALVPNMILQPLVENAVRHGVSPCESPGTITISAYRAGRALRVEVSDDGPGLQSGWRAEDCGGIGLANTIERLKRLYGAEQRFELSNGAGRGVTATFVIPFREGRGAAGAV
ncbi:MAG TPA: histidine kinase [Pyrinomonadaceae bacterium]|jgi:two-component sensor histidine kinase